MVEILEEIMGLYSQQTDIIKDFNEICEKKAELLKSDDPSKLGSMIKYEEALLMKFSFSENRKQRLLAQLRGQYGVKKITKRILRKHMQPEQIKRIERMTQDFQTSIQEQSRLRYINEKIVQSKLDEIKSAMDILERHNYQYVKREVLLDRKV